MVAALGVMMWARVLHNGRNSKVLETKGEVADLKDKGPVTGYASAQPYKLDRGSR